LNHADILIEEKEKKTIVECRHHQKKQDVKWVEEIFGRKVSLNAFSAIAVSSSGFTIGAIKKAKRLGVILRTFEDISIKEISTWGVKCNFSILYIKFIKFEVYPVSSRIITSKTEFNKIGIVDSEGELFPIKDLFSKLAKVADETNQKRNTLTAFFNIKKDLYYNGEKLEDLVVHCEFRRLNKKVWLPSVSLYSSPSKKPESQVYVNVTPFNNSEIYQTNESIFQIIDLSMVKPIDGAVFRSVTQNFDRQVMLSGMRLIGVKDMMKSSLFQFKVIPIRKNSGIYQALASRGSVTKLILSG